MLARTYSAIMSGLSPVKIEVEVDSSQGTPQLILIGLASQAIDEAKDRITAALRNCGVRMRCRRTVVNLAPAEVKKTSSSLELAIAIAILKMYGEIKINTDQTIFFGELSLDGSLKKIAGALPLVLAARQLGFTDVVLPVANTAEVSIISQIKIHPLAHLADYLKFAHQLQPLPIVSPVSFSPARKSTEVDFKEILGQEQAKRALTIAAAGGHNLLMVGPPGAGKSMLAKALTSILPPLTEAEAIDVTTIYSVCGLTDGLVTERPFRSPHHSTSDVGLIGGGNAIRPGEISLAHHGILFMDEFIEFSRSAIEALRQPLEDGVIRISRAHGTFTFPAAFSLVAAANPCPCGYAGSLKQKCQCPPHSLILYRKKLSGPILDRIDIRLRIKEVEVNQLTQFSALTKVTTQTSQQLRHQVLESRQRQLQRLTKLGKFTNAQMSNADIKKCCCLTLSAQQLLTKASDNSHLSARSYFKIIKVAQTIADLAQADQINQQHLAEALNFRKTLFA